MSRYLTVSKLVITTVAVTMISSSAFAGGPVVVPVVKPTIPAVRPTLPSITRPAWMPEPPKNTSTNPRETMYTYKDGSTAHTNIRNDGKYSVIMHSHPDKPDDKIEHFVVDPQTGFVTPGMAPSGK
jgi:hypothetical protein